MDYGDFSNPKGGYQSGPSQRTAAVPTYLTSPGPSGPEDPSKEILSRMFEVRVLFDEAKPFLPDHPAVKLVDDFINLENPRVLNISDKDPLTTESTAYLNDVRRMEEVQVAVLQFTKTEGTLVTGMSIPLARSLGDQSIFEELIYPVKFVGELYTNTTRAMLGSYDGTVTVTEVGADSVILTVVINNLLTWESLTRLPAAIGGYEGHNSYVPHITNWDIKMRFEFRVVIPAKKRTITLPQKIRF